jgi:poly(A) polymerase
MAVPLNYFLSGQVLPTVIDPFGGRDDIEAHRLRLVSDDALRSDPLRLLRAARFEAEGGWRLDPALRSAIKRDAGLINNSAAERQWDELRRIILSDRFPWALRRLERSGLLDRILPELADGRGVDQRPVHRRDVFWHQIDAVRWITRLTSPVAQRGRRSFAIWNDLRPLLDTPALRASLDDWRLPLRLATLLHDIGKPQTRTVDDDGSTHFFGHSELGAEMARARLAALRVPTRTIDQVELLIDQHLRPGQVNSPGKPPTDRALHRFHTALGDAATPLCWLFLADSLATAGADALLPRWPAYVGHVARILSWQPKRPTQTGRFLDGHAIMKVTGLQPGPLVGEIRAKIDEAAAVGEIDSLDQARELARRLAAERA